MGKRYASKECPRQWRRPKKREYAERRKPVPQAPSGACYVPSRFDIDVDPVRDMAVREILARLARKRRPTIHASAILSEGERVG
jgi:hypothetical protein